VILPNADTTWHNLQLFSSAKARQEQNDNKNVITQQPADVKRSSTKTLKVTQMFSCQKSGSNPENLESFLEQKTTTAF